MKSILFALLTLLSLPIMAQVVCNQNGNLILYTNYDGGPLNIVIDQNIPNIRIGVVSYEAVQINLSGPFVNNVSSIHYAGYNSNNNNCAVNIPTTVINGAPVTATTTIQFAPPATLSNPFGYNSIICAYSCNTNTNQGGCNTVDQIEAYFASVFPGSTLRYHLVQYNCWSGNQTMSNAGNCCANPSLPLSVSIAATQPSCYNQCNGVVTATASGGQSPYSYQWVGGPNNATWNNRCATTYSVIVTDANSATAFSLVTLGYPAPINSSVNHTACKAHFFNGQNITQSGTYTDTLTAANGCDSFLTMNLTIQTIDTSITLNGITASANMNNALYQWMNCENQTLVSGATSQSFTAPWPGMWAVIITQNNCTDTSRCINFGPNAVNDFYKSEFNFYPNPSNGIITIEFVKNFEVMPLKIHDLYGRLCYETNIKDLKSKINLSHLNQGTYFLYIGENPKGFPLVLITE